MSTTIGYPNAKVEVCTTYSCGTKVQCTTPQVFTADVEIRCNLPEGIYIETSVYITIYDGVRTSLNTGANKLSPTPIDWRAAGSAAEPTSSGGEGGGGKALGYEAMVIAKVDRAARRQLEAEGSLEFVWRGDGPAAEGGGASCGRVRPGCWREI